MKKYTKDQKQAYFKNLRTRWDNQKKEFEALPDEEQKRIISFQILVGARSVLAFYDVYRALKKQGLDGLPYQDVKTFAGWKANGFRVVKGEKAFYKAISWLDVNRDKDGEETFLIPRLYSVFHKTQVEAIK